jgi:hypothetical protein
MSEKELLITKGDGVTLSIGPVDCYTLPPDVPVYRIDTDLRNDWMDQVFLTTDEATQVALSILVHEFERRGVPAASAPLRTCARLLHVDLEDIP